MTNHSRHAENAAQPRSFSKRLAMLAANILLLVASLAISLLVAEAGFRLTQGVPLLAVADWRQEAVRTKRIGDRAVYDAALGWTLQPNYRSEGFNTIGLGVRRNFSESEIRQGGVLAVGDSFTEGFDEVDDAGTWPAHLEKILGLPVINAGVAGYATDQIVLRAEALLPAIKPTTLILGFTDADIERAAMSEAGAPKPYFTVKNDELSYHPPAALDPPVEESAVGTALRSALGHSALAHHLLSRLAPQFWYPREASVYEEVENDPVDITCRLLRRLKRQTEERSVRLLLFLQYGGDTIALEAARPEDMALVAECAAQAGIQVVDHFAPLKSVTEGKPDIIAEYYVVEDGEYGHMSSKGNDHAARLLAAALREKQPPVNASLGEKKPLPN